MSIATASDLERAPARPLLAYLWGGINLPDDLSHANVEHRREVGGTGPNLDLKYIATLGPQALAVLEAHRKQILTLLIAMDLWFPRTRDSFARSENWRAWGFRTWRLQQYLANNPDTASNFSASGKG
jgi:hypothetical protein